MSYLLDAMQGFSPHDVELHIIGGVQGSGNAFWQHKNLFQYHPPVSQFEMFKAYSDYDALLLPTIFEGFGLVIIEAMAAGLPVMTTPNSIGPEIIQHNNDGWIVPIRNSQAIKDVIQSLRNLPNDQYFNMRQNARKKALSFTWEVYQKNLQKLIEGQFRPK
jgi:glycosyltransferase involved in cell wall biosynthesis